MTADIARLIVDGVWLWTTVAGLCVGSITFWSAIQGHAFAPILVMLTVPVQRAVLVGEGGATLTWTQVALAGFFAGAAIRFLSGKLPITIDLTTIACFALIGAYAGSVLVADSPGLWAGETYRWSVALFFFIGARPYAAQLCAPTLLLATVTTLALVALGVAAAQALGGYGPASFERFGLTRAHGAFGEPNPFGAFAVMLALPGLALLVRGGTKSRARVIAAVAGAAGIATVVLTQSRGAALGLVAGLCVIGFAIWLRSSVTQQRAVVLLSAAISISVLIVAADWLAGAGPMAEVTPGNWADRERQSHWGAAAAMVRENPLLGVGAGGFDDHFRITTTEWRFRISQGHAHNAYLEVAAETGVTGLAAYVMLLGTVCSGLLGRIRSRPEYWPAWAALAVTAAIATHGLFDFVHVLSLGILLSGIWAFGMAGAQRGVEPGDRDYSL